MKYEIHASQDRGELPLEGFSYKIISDEPIEKNLNSTEKLVLTREESNIRIEKYRKSENWEEFCGTREIGKDSRNYEMLDNLLKEAGI